ncbi:uncharacterized protein [Spinacia oleracea]|uniref:Uncharacterized protein n=1 Tax=Spinacia oleracea TaxID=3562 RepID=A0ABM3QZ35_SPIOL|nr:uncharacterized protein LOC130463524 [Spinacia oleracea]
MKENSVKEARAAGIKGGEFGKQRCRFCFRRHGGAAVYATGTLSASSVPRYRLSPPPHRCLICWRRRWGSQLQAMVYTWRTRPHFSSQRSESHPNYVLMPTPRNGDDHDGDQEHENHPHVEGNPENLVTKKDLEHMAAQLNKAIRNLQGMREGPSKKQPNRPISSRVSTTSHTIHRAQPRSVMERLGERGGAQPRPHRPRASQDARSVIEEQQLHIGDLDARDLLHMRHLEQAKEAIRNDRITRGLPPSSAKTTASARDHPTPSRQVDPIEVSSRRTFPRRHSPSPIRRCHSPSSRIRGHSPRTRASPPDQKPRSHSSLHRPRYRSPSRTTRSPPRRERTYSPLRESKVRHTSPRGRWGSPPPRNDRRKYTSSL